MPSFFVEFRVSEHRQSWFRALPGSTKIESLRYEKPAGRRLHVIITTPMNSIVGLFTDVLPAGGVQRAGRHVAAVTAKLAADRGMAARFLSLNDPQGLHTVRVGLSSFP